MRALKPSDLLNPFAKLLKPRQGPKTAPAPTTAETL
jgi:hypothetical protein